MRIQKIVGLLAVLGLVMAWVAPAAAEPKADWHTLITPEDQTRLDQFAAARVRAVDEANAGVAAKEANAADVPLMTGLLNPAAIPARDEDLIGDYKCRTAKFGGQYVPLIFYGWFQCRIEVGPEGTLVIKKTSGSQRFIGRLFREADGRYTYLGSAYVQGDKPWAYNEHPDDNQVGVLSKIGPKRLRLELPLPKYESTFDVIELVSLAKKPKA